MIRLPLAPSIGPQPMQSPSSDAPRVIPVHDASAAQLTALGQAAEGAGLAMARVGDVLQERFDEARAREADAKLADADREVLTSPQGFFNLLGRDALDGRKAAVDALAENRTRLAATLTSPAQREMFEQVAEARRQRNLTAIDAHYAQQLQVYSVAETTARAGALLRDALTAYFYPTTAETEPQDPPGSTFVGPPAPGTPSPRGAQDDARSGPPQHSDPFVESSRAYLNEIRALAAQKGLGPDATKALVAEAQDKLHEGVVEKLLTMGRSAEAAHYLSGAQVSDGVKASLLSKVQTGVTKDVAQRITSAMIGQGSTLAANLEAADKAYRDGKINVAVFDEVRQRLGEQHGAIRTANNQQREDAWRVITESLAAHGLQVTTQLQQLIDDNQLQDRFDVYVKSGMQTPIDEFGRQLLYQSTGDTLYQTYHTEADVVAAAAPHMPPEQVGRVLERWKSAADKAPRADPELMVANALRDVAKVPYPQKLDDNLLALWTDRVKGHYNNIRQESPPSTPDGAMWKLATERASKEGVYRDAARTDFKLTVASIAAGERITTGYIGLTDGTSMQIDLDAMNPNTGMTYGQTVDAIWNAEAMQHVPATDFTAAKPVGWVMVQGRAKRYDDVTAEDRMRAVWDLIGPDEKQRRDNIVVDVHNAVSAEMQRATRTGPSGKSAAQIHAEAMKGIARRADEWRAKGLSLDEVFAAAGETEAERKERKLREEEELVRSMIDWGRR